MKDNDKMQYLDYTDKSIMELIMTLLKDEVKHIGLDSSIRLQKQSTTIQQTLHLEMILYMRACLHFPLITCHNQHPHATVSNSTDSTDGL